MINPVCYFMSDNHTTFRRKFEPANRDVKSRKFSLLRFINWKRIKYTFSNSSIGIRNKFIWGFCCYCCLRLYGSNCGVKWCCFNMLMHKEAQDININIHHLEHSINSDKDKLPSTYSLSAPLPLFFALPVFLLFISHFCCESFHSTPTKSTSLCGGKKVFSCYAWTCEIENNT